MTDPRISLIRTALEGHPVALETLETLETELDDLRSTLEGPVSELLAERDRLKAEVEQLRRL